VTPDFDFSIGDTLVITDENKKFEYFVGTKHVVDDRVYSWSENQ